jgi:hypothetical protein
MRLYINNRYSKESKSYKIKCNELGGKRVPYVESNTESGVQ